MRVSIRGSARISVRGFYTGSIYKGSRIVSICFSISVSMSVSTRSFYGGFCKGCYKGTNHKGHKGSRRLLLGFNIGV